MIDIKAAEETVLIEANDFNWPIHNLINELKFMNKDLSIQDIYSYASKIIGSLTVQGFIELVKTSYVDNGNESYTADSEQKLSEEENNIILKKPEEWDRIDIMSLTEVYEMKITDKGREYLESM